MQSSSFRPQEIIIDILSRLPAKSIGRCKCLSNPWRALLSQPQFIKTHLDRVRKLQQQSLILISDSGSLYSVTLSDEINEPVKKLCIAGHPNNWPKVIASCDGLALVRGSENNKFLINPITGEIKQVPPLPFALDPFASYTEYGLGYDPINDDYKIVSLSYYHPDIRHELNGMEIFVNVYSVKNGSWKKTKSYPSPYDHIIGYITSGVSIDGYVHWVASLTGHDVIVSLDLAQERFFEVPSPSSIANLVFDSFVELGGCLGMSRTIYNYGFEVWIMEEYSDKESWTKFAIIDRQGAEFRPLCLLGQEQEQIVLVKFEDASDEKLVKYNLENGTFKDIIVHGILDYFHIRGTFIESLVSPHSSHEQTRQG